MNIRIESIEANIVDISTKEKEGILIDNWVVKYHVHSRQTCLSGKLVIKDLPSIPIIYSLIELDIKSLL